MNIVQTKKISALPIQEAREEEFSIFQGRRSLHQAQIPNFFVYINEYAWDAFLNHTKGIYARSGHEGQGILLGKYFKDNSGEFVVATTYFEGEGESAHAYVGMSEQCLSNISKKCLAEDLLMLIWIHTHPNFGAFYSGTDVNCLKTNFFMPFQIGIVVDIIREDLKGFKVQFDKAVEFSNYSLYNSQKQRLFKPFKSDKLEIVSTKSIEIKKKERPEMAQSLAETISQEIRTPNEVLEAIKALIIKHSAEASNASQSALSIEDIISLKTDIAFIRDQVSAKPSEPVSSTSIEHLENIKAEIASIKEWLTSPANNPGIDPSFIEGLEKQNRLQLNISVIVSAITLIALSLVIYLLLR